MLDDIVEMYNYSLLFQNFCEGIEDENFKKDIFSVKFKILFLIYRYKQLSPSNLVNFLNMAKSNVALFCKQLLKEQLIISKQDELDHRIIYYCLTKKGEKYIVKNLNLVDCCCKKKFATKDLKDIFENIKNLNVIFTQLGDK